MLAQKPLALDLESARRVVEAADEAGVKLAVNQNGRWCPPLRAATLLVAAGRRRRRRRRHAPPRQEHAAGRRPPLRRARPLRDLRLRRPLDRHQPLLARRRPSGRGARVRLPRAGPARTTRAIPGARPCEIRWASGANVLIRTVGDARTARAGRAVLDPRHRGHDPRQRPARLGLPRARPRRRGRAVRARGRLVPGGPRGDDGRAAVGDRRGPRAVQLGPPQPAVARADAGRVPLGRPADGAPVAL